MFGSDFYPTPPEVAGEMLDPFDLRGKVVLEPSAGKGDLVSQCILRGASEVLTVEPEPELRAILASIPESRLIGSDFLRVLPEEVSHIDFIVMNPPFSADEDHILHAFEIAPPGCDIISLCNWATVDSGFQFRKRNQLRYLVEQYGSSENLGDVFSEAERKTKVEIGLVRLKKPGVKEGKDEFEGFYLGPDDVEAQGQGLIQYRKSRDIVNRYVEACRIYDQQVDAAVRLHNVLDGFYGKSVGMQITQSGEAISRRTFRNELQKSAWKYVFDSFLPQHLATTQLASDINKFVEKNSKIPFTERNIYRMLQIVAATHEQRIDRAVEEVFDKLTKHTKENRWNVEGWATNSQYLFNKKFILDYVVEPTWDGSGLSLKMWSSHSYGLVQDLIKALCFLTGEKYEDVKLPEHQDSGEKYLTGEWYDWGFFTFKGFKKGTAHFKFRNEEHWAILNQRIAKIKGYALPGKLNRKSKMSR